MSAQLLKELQEIRVLLSLQKEVLTLEEFCLYAGISKNQAYHLTSSGKVKFYRPFGKMIYFKVSEVAELLTANQVIDDNTKVKKVNNAMLNTIV